METIKQLGGGGGGQKMTIWPKLANTWKVNWQMANIEFGQNEKERDCVVSV